MRGDGESVSADFMTSLRAWVQWEGRGGGGEGGENSGHSMETEESDIQ